MTTRLIANRRPFHVLLAEDDREMRRVISEALRKAGYRVTECTDGLALLDQLCSYLHAREAEPAQPPVIDVLISDIRMPGVNGMSILEGSQEFPGMPPVILITAFGDQATHNAARRWGARMALNS